MSDSVLRLDENWVAKMKIRQLNDDDDAANNNQKNELIVKHFRMKLISLLSI